MMAAWSAFFPMIAPLVSGAPNIAMNNAARYGAIEFCKRTLCLQRTLASVATVANQSDYTLVQSGEVVEKLLGVKLNGKPMTLRTPTELDQLQDLTNATTPTDALLIEPMKVRLYPTPSVDDLSIVARAAMRPSQTATTVDDTVFERHAQAIADYAAYWLMMQPGSAFANPKEAAAPLARFMDAVGLEKAAVLLSHSRSSPRAAVKWF